MVNKKLDREDEDQIYLEWLSGKPLAIIADNYPVVISTIQRVVKKKCREDGTKKNFTVSNTFKHLKNTNDPIKMVLKIMNDNQEHLHEKQKEFLLKTLSEISTNIELLIKKIESC